MNNSSKTGYYYDKNKNAVLCNTGMVSIIGGYLNSSITNFCTMFVPISDKLHSHYHHEDYKSEAKSGNVYQSNEVDDKTIVEMQISSEK